MALYNQHFNFTAIRISESAVVFRIIVEPYLIFLAVFSRYLTCFDFNHALIFSHFILCFSRFDSSYIINEPALLFCLAQQ